MLDLPTWEHVGALLLSYGITDGLQRNCDFCPIALFLETVTSQTWSVGGLTAWADNDPRNYRLPDAALDFIEGFDLGRWVA
jgi:hypothetical protein